MLQGEALGWIWGNNGVLIFACLQVIGFPLLSHSPSLYCRRYKNAGSRLPSWLGGPLRFSLTGCPGTGQAAVQGFCPLLCGR